MAYTITFQLLRYVFNTKAIIIVDSSFDGKKNNNDKPVITPVPDTQCHCCAEDLRTAHSGGEFTCEICSLSFKKKSSLERHTVVIHWQCESSICKDCGETFHDKKALNKHRYTTHADRKVFRQIYLYCSVENFTERYGRKM